MIESAGEALRLETAGRKGFIAGLNVGLVSIGVLCALSAAGRSLYELPRFRDVFLQVKVPMPGLTLLVLDHYPVVVTALLLGAIVCVAATCRWGHRRRTIVLNGALLFAALSWMALSVLAMYLPFLSIMEGIGVPRR